MWTYAEQLVGGHLVYQQLLNSDMSDRGKVGPPCLHPTAKPLVLPLVVHVNVTAHSCLLQAQNLIEDGDNPLARHAPSNETLAATCNTACETWPRRDECEHNE